MTSKSQFGKALKFVRKKKGLTQEDFSNVSSRTYLSTLERGLKSPTLEKIEQLASVLRIHPITLMSLAYVRQDKTKSAALLNQIAAEIDSLNS